MSSDTPTGAIAGSDEARVTTREARMGEGLDDRFNSKLPAIAPVGVSLLIV